MGGVPCRAVNGFVIGPHDRPIVNEPTGETYCLGVVAAPADELGISHAHLDRAFARLVGLTPRVLSRILRMRRLLESIDPSRPVRWTEEAERWGWFDQAHLIRDFKRHTGVTPSQYLAAQRTYEDGDAAPGFVRDVATSSG